MRLNYNLTVHNDKVPYLEIKDLYSEDERKRLLEEMLAFEKLGVLIPGWKTGTASEKWTGQPKKQNNGFFTHGFFGPNGYEELSIGQMYDKRLLDFLSKDKDFRKDGGWHFNIDFKEPMHLSSLVSYYEDSDYYLPHSDHAWCTALTWFYVEPKKFKGGVLSFSDYNIDIEPELNKTIIFPSQVNHAVSPVKIQDKDKGKGLGRFVMSTFIQLPRTIWDNPPKEKITL